MLRSLALAVLGVLPIVAGGHSAGSPMAPVRIELYSDYQCPACRVFHEQTLGPLMEAYVKTGKVYLVRRELPLPIHAHSLAAAKVACAAEQIGQYEAVCNQLFRAQDDWAKSGDPLGAACRVLSTGDAARLKAAVNAAGIARTLDEDLRAAQAERVTGTPTMIITKSIRRYPVAGSVSYAILSRFLDSILK